MDLRENIGGKLFQDSVHGVMRFHDLLIKIIDTREFQRLRNIKQLSTTYLVYPAAAHNRFEHCLGVCWLAGQLLEELQNNSPRNWKKILPDEEEAKAIKLAVQVAALLHDVGHGPFSHTWENFLAASKKEWDHETTSCLIIDLMVWKTEIKSDDNLTKLGQYFKEEFADVPKYVNFIQDLIKGKEPSNGPATNRSFLYQIVANKANDIDVDKFDYFLRDAQHLNFGLSFDHKRLMSLCRIEMEKGTSLIAFRDVERYSIETMFRVRADLHIRAYQHRVAKCLEAMLIDGLKEADKAGFKVGGCLLSEIHKDSRQFIKITDSIQETILNSEEECYEGARAILTRILTRDLYKLVGEWTLDVRQTPEEELQNRPPAGLKKGKILELESLLEHKFAVTQMGINRGKYHDPIKKVRFYSKDGLKGITVQRKERSPGFLMELPFYKIYVFKRSYEDCNLNNVKKTVEDFLRKEGVLKPDEEVNA